MTAVEGFLCKNVEGGTGDFPPLKRFDEILLDDEIAAADIDKYKTPSFICSIVRRLINCLVSGADGRTPHT